MHGIIIDNKHSYYDWGAVMTAREIGYPQQIKITETVPYSNIVYDFSYIYGDKTYSERTLQYELTIAIQGVKNRVKLNFFANEIVNWLQSYKSKTKVIDTYLPQYYFLAECTDVTVSYFAGTAKISVSFTAYPFRIPLDSNSGLSEVI